MNRKMKVHDSFTVLFPHYNHGNPSVLNEHKPESHKIFVYPDRNDMGRPTHRVNKEHFQKRDFVNDQHEAFIRVASIKRIYKA